MTVSSNEADEIKRNIILLLLFFVHGSHYFCECICCYINHPRVASSVDDLSKQTHTLNMKQGRGERERAVDSSGSYKEKSKEEGASAAEAAKIKVAHLFCDFPSGLHFVSLGEFFVSPSVL